MRKKSQSYIKPVTSSDSPSSNPKQLTVRIWRGAEEGQLQTYQVQLRRNQTVLDVVTEIQRTQEPSLAYRFACRVGVCGSCAMTVNGIPRWTCRTHVNTVLSDDNALTIEPLNNHPRLKDLVTDLDPFLNKWNQAGAVFMPSTDREQKPAGINPQSAARQAANEAIECINCAVCYSACDSVRWNRDYAGPAALNRAWSLLNDARHADREETADKAFASNGCSSCHSIGNCTRYCPVSLSPARSIAGIKRSALRGLPSLNTEQE